MSKDTATKLIVFYDDVTPSKIPAGAKRVAYYADGHYANGTEMKQRFPKASMLSITVEGGNADACDCESGDMTVAQAISWAEARVKAGHYRPIVYANSDTWNNKGLKSGLSHLGSKIRRWIAAYPGTGANVPAGFDAHQYATGAVDTNVALPNFFDKSAPKPKPPPHSSGKANASISVDLKKETAGIHHTSGSAKFAGPKKTLTFEVTIKSGSGGGTWAVKKKK